MRFQAIRNSIRLSFGSPDRGGKEPGSLEAGPRPNRLYALVAGLVILCLMTVYGIVMYRGQADAMTDAQRLTQSVA